MWEKWATVPKYRIPRNSVTIGVKCFELKSQGVWVISSPDSRPLPRIVLSDRVCDFSKHVFRRWRKYDPNWILGQCHSSDLNGSCVIVNPKWGHIVLVVVIVDESLIRRTMGSWIFHCLFGIRISVRELRTSSRYLGFYAITKFGRIDFRSSLNLSYSEQVLRRIEKWGSNFTTWFRNWIANSLRVPS